MKKIAFTLIEVLVAIIIVTIVASLSMAAYQKVAEANASEICLQNLNVLQAAIDVYALENDTLPTTLSQLSPRHIYLAYEKVSGTRKENAFIKLVKGLFKEKTAIAQVVLPQSYYGSNPKVLKCPKDTSSISYVINPESSDKNNSKFYDNNKKLKKDSAYALVYDNAPRHKEGFISATTYANGITPGGKKGKIDNNKIVTDKNKDTEDTEEKKDKEEKDNN